MDVVDRLKKTWPVAAKWTEAAARWAYLGSMVWAVWRWWMLPDRLNSGLIWLAGLVWYPIFVPPYAGITFYRFLVGSNVPAGLAGFAAVVLGVLLAGGYALAIRCGSQIEGIRRTVPWLFGDRRWAPARTTPAGYVKPVEQQGGGVSFRRNPKAFDGLVGVDHAVEAIKDALELPLKYPDKAKEYGVKVSKGILLYGPAGTGKTSLARAAASYFGCAFRVVNASSLMSKYVGTSEQALQSLFAWARQNRPSIIFFDEIDAIGRKRDGSHLNRPSDILLNLLLSEMDGFYSNEGVFVMAATNRLDVLDDALLRPGRFDRCIEVGLPGPAGRRKLFEMGLTGYRGYKLEEMDYDALVAASEGMSPAQITEACEETRKAALKRDIAGGERKVRTEDVLTALEAMKRTKPKGGEGA